MSEPPSFYDVQAEAAALAAGRSHLLCDVAPEARPVDLTPAERTLVMSALKRFEHERYELTAYVVMNDHVHVLVEPMRGHPLQDIVRSWKSYTAHCFQRQNGRHGSVWLVESFDRVVRDEAELLEKAQYILNNPRKRWPEITQYPWVWVQGQQV